MKIIFKLILIVVSILYCGITYGQNEFVTLTSSDLIKGLDNKDYLRKKLIENGFTIIGKTGIGITKTGFYESWQFKSMLYVDIIYSPGKENTIKVGIHETLTGLPERLIQSFPHKKIEKIDEHLPTINVTPINKEISYSLAYSRDSDNVRVVIWYDYPYYFFEYKDEK
ncbi:MAG: hypothetical protein ABSF81_10750 [Bacteroidales bacterium]